MNRTLGWAWIGNGSCGSDRYTLITGGAGFVGSNLAHRLLSEGRRVLLLDNLSRGGVMRNLAWLRRVWGSAVMIHVADTRDPDAIRHAVQGADQVFHLAGQVAVTTSLGAPVTDFQINAAGTLNLLEALRRLESPPPLVFSSTNKVYGQLTDIDLGERPTRYEPRDVNLGKHGINEDRALEFCSPYGCSKGTADQYVLDYARSFNLPTVVFRMSCVYGSHQMGNEDQGWVAHFLLRAIRGEPITLYGNGKQVRDVLFIDDLVDALIEAARHIERLSGRAFNIGGGPGRTVSLLELLERIEAVRGGAIPVTFRAWRDGDQRYYVSDTRRFEQATGWRPRRSVEEGLKRLHDWLAEAAPAAAPEDEAGGARPVLRRHGVEGRQPTGVQGQGGRGDAE